MGVWGRQAGVVKATEGTGGKRSGMVALVGRTNVGKSTLMNALVGRKVTIVTSKPQTTRHAIQGVVEGPRGQMVLVDTPGFFRTDRSALVDRLHARAREVLEGIDVVVHVVDPTRPVGEEEGMVGEVLAGVSVARVLCLNKRDHPERLHRKAWLDRASGYVSVVEVSALRKEGLEALLDVIWDLLPEGEPMYGPEEFTNASREFRITEAIRERIYDLTEEEVPYRTAVRLDTMETVETPSGRERLRLQATILVAEERYKAMVIGAGGRMVREIRLGARLELERLMNCRVELELRVKVDRSAVD